MVIFTDSERKAINEQLAAKPVPFALQRKLNTTELKNGTSIEVGSSEVSLLKVVLMNSGTKEEENWQEQFLFKTKDGHIFMFSEGLAMRQVIGLQQVVDKLTKEYESRAFENAAKQRESTKQKAEAADKAVVENSINEQSLTNWGNW